MENHKNSAVAEFAKRASIIMALFDARLDAARGCCRLAADYATSERSKSLLALRDEFSGRVGNVS